MKCKNMPERKFASSGDQTHNHQVMSLLRSPLSHLGGAANKINVIQMLWFIFDRVEFHPYPYNPDF